MLCGLIMAGGKGTRFWPLSTEDKPKQFLKLLGEDTMLQMTMKRLDNIIPIERIFICTCKKYVELVKSQIPMLPERNIIVEPEGRNTAPCIALSAFYIKRYYKDSSIMILPSDQLIKEEEEFGKILLAGQQYIEREKNAIITLGINPDRPETGYGYIKCSNEFERIEENKIISVHSFVEKPDIKKAKEYLKDGRYLWNSGIFIGNIENLLDSIKKYCNATYNILEDIAKVEEVKLQEYIDEVYGNCESVSIDYALLEKAPNIKVIPCDFGWDDVGSWTALERYRRKDQDYNIKDKNTRVIESKNNIVISNNKKIVFYGVDDMFCIDTEDLIIVTTKEHMNDMKNIKEKIN